MHRIIYFDPNLGYKSAYIRNSLDLINKQVEITNQENHIICILDIDGKTVLKKFESFFKHAVFVNGIRTLPEYVLAASSTPLSSITRS